MQLIADLLLIAAAIGAAFYCFILSRRLSTLNSAEGGIGEAITTLSDRVAQLEQTLKASRQSAEDAERGLRETLKKAEEMETALAAALSVTSQLPMRTQVKPQPQRAEAQPASFRRRLFSDTARESGS